MKKRKKLNDYIFTVLLRLPCLMLFLCYILLLFGQYLYLPPFSTEELCCLSICAIVYSFIISCGIDWCRDRQRWYYRALKILAVALALLLAGSTLLIPAAFSGLFGAFQRCDSPDGQHGIVIEEESTFAVEWSTVYIMTSPITMKEICSFDGGFQPDPQTIVWHDTYVELIWQEESQRFYYSQD